MKFSDEFMKKDGTYSWLVLMVIILNNFCCTGYLFGGAGVLSEVYPRLLDLDPSITNAIGSALIGSFLFSTPFNAILLTTVGIRTVAALSCVLTVAGVVSSAFSTQLWHFILGFCIVGGIGISMNLLASISIVPSYFEKRKTAAYACTGLGEGIGLVAYPYIMSALIAKYEFKIGVLLVSPIIALSATSAIVFNPKAETLKLGRRGNATELVKTYFKPLRTFVAPFYLLNSYLWQGGLGGVILLLFNHVAAHTSTSVAVLCYSILGFGMLISTILYTLYLLKYSLNHYILEIVVNIAAGVTTIIIGLVGTDITYYVLFGVMGFIYGLTIANIPCIASHVFEARHIEYAFGFYQICGGIGANVVTLTAGLLFEKYSALLSLCYVGGHIILAGIMLIIPAVMRPSIWKSKMSLPLNSDSNKEIDSTDSPIDPEAT